MCNPCALGAVVVGVVLYPLVQLVIDEQPVRLAATRPILRIGPDDAKAVRAVEGVVWKCQP